MMDKLESKQPKLTSAFDLFSKSSALVRANLNIYALLYIPPLLMSILDMTESKSGYGKEFSGVNISGVPTGLLASAIGFGALLVLAFMVINVIVAIMLYVLNLRVSEGKSPRLQELWSVTKKFGPRMFGLLVAVVFVVLVGLLLLIVPGLIFIRRYFLAPYILLDENVTIGEAMKMSGEMTKPHSGAIWGIIGVSVLIGFVSVVPYIGSLISFGLAALYSVAPALRYRELKALHKTRAS